MVSPFITTRPLVDIVRFLKFHGGTAAAGPLAGWMSGALESYPGRLGDPVIVHVPLHWSRLARRGYDQAGLIAAGVSERTGIAAAPGVLTRRRRTRAQSTLPPQQRSVNVEGAFALRRAGRVAGRDVVLIDDLVTTGGTVAECCRVLRSAGPSSITVLCAGRPAESGEK